MAKYILPAGTYFFGDPCYAMNRDSYGLFWPKIPRGGGTFEHEGHAYFVGPTAFGDGEYNGYPVDSGQLGLIPLAGTDPERLERVKNEELGRMITSTSEIVMDYESGIFYLMWNVEDGAQIEYVNTDFYGDDEYAYDE